MEKRPSRITTGGSGKTALLATFETVSLDYDHLILHLCLECFRASIKTPLVAEIFHFRSLDVAISAVLILLSDTTGMKTFDFDPLVNKQPIQFAVLYKVFIAS